MLNKENPPSDMVMGQSRITISGGGINIILSFGTVP
jgi:hypothetical protein